MAGPMGDGAQRSQKAAALKEQARTAKQRRQLTIAAVLVAVLVVGVGVFIYLSGRSGDKAPPVATPASTAQGTQLSALTSLTAKDFDEVGVGLASAPAAARKAPAPKVMEKDGKPVVIYLGSETCNHCAAQRWATVAALARFGTFQQVPETQWRHSSGKSIPTFTFHGSSYSSDLISFQGIEVADDKGKRQDPVPDDLVTYLEGNKTGDGVPWMGFAGQSFGDGSLVGFELLLDKSSAQVVSELADTTSDTRRAIIGGANVVSAAICAQTKGQPAAVCESPGVKAGAELVK